MSEAPTTRPGRTTAPRGRRGETPALLVALVAIFVLSLAQAPRTGAEDGEAFAGTDSQVTGTLTEAGAKPWFSPIFEPGSTEVESGLFALQAALGAGLFGYALGNLRGRRTERERLLASGTITPLEPTVAPTTVPMPQSPEQG